MDVLVKVLNDIEEAWLLPPHEKERLILAQHYHEYLLSWKWRRKRDKVLERDKHRCQYCGNTASDVCHLTYENVFAEPLSDLISVCRECHEK